MHVLEYSKSLYCRLHQGLYFYFMLPCFMLPGKDTTVMNVTYDNMAGDSPVSPKERLWRKWMRDRHSYGNTNVEIRTWKRRDAKTQRRKRQEWRKRGDAKTEGICGDEGKRFLRRIDSSDKKGKKYKNIVKLQASRRSHASVICATNASSRCSPLASRTSQSHRVAQRRL
jgi:hypothetical protein